MKRRHLSALAGVAVAAVAMSVVSVPAQATPAQGDKEPKAANRQHDLPNPLGDAQRALRKEAVDKLVKGEATTETRGGQRVIKLKGNAKAPRGSKAAADRYVSYPVNRAESIFTILSEFGDQVDATTGGTPGPVHNTIPEPDRNWDGGATDDNSSIWKSNFDRPHFVDLMFGADKSMKDFYLKQSNGRFLAKGDVSDWVKVPFNEARYGSNKITDAQGAWPFVRDSASSWYDAQVASGKTPADIKTYLAQFDQVDRYDHDSDGVFAEADGYIDHFQAIHAGVGEEVGGGEQGEDAIWSHRWYAYSNDIGKTGPEGNALGGVPLGDSGMWIGDYTTEPENGGLGVFAHEFAHDLGLPDLYDTAGGDNGTGFWTIMSGGSYLNPGGASIGNEPGYMGPWEKLQLGWLNHRTVKFGEDADVKLGAADRDSKSAAEAILVSLPDKTVSTKYNTPHSGSTEWWGGSADNLQNTLTRSVDLTGKSSASLSTWLEHDIEAEYDYLYTEVSTDGGASWTTLGTPIDGQSPGWVQKSWDLTPYVGKAVQVRFRYATDGGLHFKGPFLDDITVAADGTTLLSDDVESGDNGWTADGFTRMSGETDKTVSHYYLAENRVYSGYDAGLKTGPYNFGWASTKPDWVERFPYQNGMVVWYSDGAYTDNNTRTHPGGGEALPVDARPATITFSDGVKLGNRRQPFDASFGLERTDAVTFHRNGLPQEVPSSPAMPQFDDTDPNRYWAADNPWHSTKVAGTGTSMTVAQMFNAEEMLVQVRFK